MSDAAIIGPPEQRVALNRAWSMLREAERDAETAGFELNRAAAASCYGRAGAVDVMEQLDGEMRAAMERAGWYRRGVRLLEARLEIIRDPFGNVLDRDSSGVGLR